MTGCLRNQFATLCVSVALSTGIARADEAITPFMQGLARAATADSAVAAFYRTNGYEAIWTDPEPDDRERLAALIGAFREAHAHALPVGRFSEDEVRRRLAAVATEADRAGAEAEMSRLFLSYAHAVQSGILESDQITAGIKRTPPRRDGTALLNRLMDEPARSVLRSLPPASPEYAHLLRARMELTETIAGGSWGEQVPSGPYEVGDGGPGVVALRNRLIAMGYLERTAADTYGPALEAAVRKFQDEHGLLVDGVAGGNTLREINLSAEDRLGQIIVAMERERWMNLDRGARHVWVNLADYRAQLIDEGRVTFESKVVVGAAASDRRSPEFSDEMEHLIINPTWHVPRSIAVNEYLPQFRRNPNSNSHLTIYYQGQAISRDRINWPAVTADNWPFALKQPPSNSNALGLVKFMFPNRWNIYLHDTPEKHLFDRSARAFSHGCIRLHRPFDFAYTLLARQTSDPQGFFQSRLDTGRETRVDLDEHVPVHIVYRTAFTTPRGELRFRPDVYGRDREVLSALQAAGVEIGGLRS